MFKVVKPEYTNKTFRMPTELVKTLGQTAHDMGVSMNNLVVQCCEYAIGNLTSPGNEGGCIGRGSATLKESTKKYD